MILKKLLACMFVVALIVCNASAFAMTTTGYKEDTYNAAIRGLESYLESFGNSSAELAGIAATFRELGGYSQSLYFGYYVSVLQFIADENFTFKMTTYLDMMESNTEFDSYLRDVLKGSSIGTVDKLKTYALGRECQHNGEKDKAAAYYRECLSFCDASQRYEGLIGDSYQTVYESAFALLNAGDYAGAYFQFDSISSYNDSKAIMASIVNQLGYTPASPTDNLMPVSGLSANAKSTSQIELRWDKSVHATAYEIYYKKHSDQQWMLYRTISQDESGIIIDNLDNAITYDFKVVSIIGRIKADDSSFITGTTKLVKHTYGDYEYVIADNAATITWYYGSAATLTIPETIDGYSVTSIGDAAFESKESLTNITIPSSVTSIGDAAFSCCHSLTSVTFHDGVITHIGGNPFSDCGKLTSILISENHSSLCLIDGALIYKPENRLVCYPRSKASSSYIIPSSVASIGDKAFCGCDSLTNITIPISVTSIGDEVFSYCWNLTTVTFHDGFTYIGANPFECCVKLTNILISEDHPSLSLIDGVLIYKPENRLVCYPVAKRSSRYIIPSSITSIGDGAFWSCSSLTNITIPSSVTSIGDYAFWACDSLTNISIPSSVTSIGDGTFIGCDSFTNITIPSSVASIGDGAFLGCSNLTNITIPSSVTSIGIGAFEECSPNLIITVAPESYALQYCKDNSLAYRIE